MEIIMNRCIELFWIFFKIGLFSIGGGYAVIPLIREQVVDTAKWLSDDAFMNIITISQMTPGPLAVNVSTFAGIRTMGIAGGALATLGCVMPGVIVALLLDRLFCRHRASVSMQAVRKGLKSASLGLIMAAGATLLVTAFMGEREGELNRTAIVVFLLCMAVQRKIKMSPMVLLLMTGAAGLFLYGGL